MKRIKPFIELLMMVLFSSVCQGQEGIEYVAGSREMRYEMSGEPAAPSCEVFRRRLSLVLQRKGEYLLLKEIESGRVNLKIVEQAKGIMARANIPIPTASDGVSVRAVFNVLGADFDFSQFTYQINTAAMDFWGQSPYFLDGWGFKDLGRSAIEFEIRLSYAEACLLPSDVLITLKDSVNRTIRLKVVGGYR